MDYLALLEHSYEVERSRGWGCPPETRLQYLSRSIFDFTTYDGGMDELFASWAVRVCDAITERTTFDMCGENAGEEYQWYLIMLNIPFFAKRTTWGGSVRGAWWEDPISFQSCGLWDGDKQLAESIRFRKQEWESFMRAVVAFARKDKQ